MKQRGTIKVIMVSSVCERYAHLISASEMALGLSITTSPMCVSAPVRYHCHLRNGILP